jgi:hypothetical protein
MQIFTRLQHREFETQSLFSRSAAICFPSGTESIMWGCDERFWATLSCLM